jgi:hypothetical protein
MMAGESKRELMKWNVSLQALCSEAYCVLLGAKMPDDLLDRLDDAACGYKPEDWGVEAEEEEDFCDEE